MMKRESCCVWAVVGVVVVVWWLGGCVCVCGCILPPRRSRWSHKHHDVDMMCVCVCVHDGLSMCVCVYRHTHTRQRGLGALHLSSSPPASPPFLRVAWGGMMRICDLKLYANFICLFGPHNPILLWLGLAQYFTRATRLTSILCAPLKPKHFALVDSLQHHPLTPHTHRHTKREAHAHTKGERESLRGA